MCACVRSRGAIFLESCADSKMTHTNIHTYIHTHMYTYMHAYVHTYIFYEMSFTKPHTYFTAKLSCSLSHKTQTQATKSMHTNTHIQNTQSVARRPKSG